MEESLRKFIRLNDCIWDYMCMDMDRCMCMDMYGYG